MFSNVKLPDTSKLSVLEAPMQERIQQMANDYLELPMHLECKVDEKGLVLIKRRGEVLDGFLINREKPFVAEFVTMRDSIKEASYYKL